MLEVDDVMGFDLLLYIVLFGLAVLYKLPKALALVLIDDARSDFIGPLDGWSFPHIVIPHICLHQLSLVYNGRVQVNNRVVVDKVHEAVSAYMVDE